MIMTWSKSGTGSKLKELPICCQLSKEVIQPLILVLEELSMDPLSFRVMAHWMRLFPMTKESLSRGSASIHSATTSGELMCSGVGQTQLEASRERATSPSTSTN